MIARRVLEICCDSLESALAAAEGGAHRIELCVDLPADGLTPPVQLLRAVKAAVQVPVFVLVRCRAGDFVYSDSEVDTMCGQIESLGEAGADGIVGGALTGGGAIDLTATSRLMGAADGSPFTFHKAFDTCEDLEYGMGQLVELGVDRVLTSGGERRAVDAVRQLARLAEIGGEKTRILCGGGVRSANLGELVNIPRVTEFHSAARASAALPADAGEVRAMQALLAK